MTNKEHDLTVEEIERRATNLGLIAVFLGGLAGIASGHNIDLENTKEFKGAMDTLTKDAKGLAEAHKKLTKEPTHDK